MTKRTKTNTDVVNRPQHYNRKGIECLLAIEASMSDEEFKGYLKGNFIKYVWRYPYKGKPLEDLKKGEFYLKRLIEIYELNSSKEKKKGNRRRTKTQRKSNSKRSTKTVKRARKSNNHR